MKLSDVLCASCRKIHPVYSNGRREESSLEEIFRGYEINPSNPMLNDVYRHLKDLLMSNGGCSRCVDSVGRHIR
jgi:hypothetical protein